MRSGAIFVAGILMGLLLGLAYSSSSGSEAPPVMPPIEEPPTRAEPSMGTTSPIIIASTKSSGVTRPAASAIDAGEGQPPAADALATEKARLEAQLAETQRQLASLQAQQRGEKDEPIAPPADLPERFSQKALLETAQAALKEAGFETAQVTSIDCTEHPCLIYGEGMGGREDFEKLNGARALEPYRDDGRMAFGWGMGGGDGGATRMFFGYAVYPTEEDPEKKKAMRQRIQRRTDEMRATFEP